MRRQQLTEAQITALLDPPTDQRELVRHYTLTAADLAAIRRCRGDHNRLGHALMLCYLGSRHRTGARFTLSSKALKNRSYSTFFGLVSNNLQIILGTTHAFVSP